VAYSGDIFYHKGILPSLSVASMSPVLLHIGSDVPRSLGMLWSISRRRQPYLA
jgi:hypothetical protein